jgi:hypothetical protein
MPDVLFRLRTTILLVSCFVGLLGAHHAPAQTPTIDLSLNVFYSDPSNVNSGGTWELVGKSSHAGIVGVSALLTNIDTAQREGPSGTVNGSDPAGFSLFHNTLNPLGFRNITLGQVVIPPINLGAGEEQTAFYGVGLLVSGAPNYAGQPIGTDSIGPLFTSLSVPAMNSGIPWAATNSFGDPAWSAAATLASGTFTAGLTPGFFSNGGFQSSGNVFTTLGSSTQPGAIHLANVSTIVRTNFSSAMPDYNNSGVVDAADYVLWRNALGQSGAHAAADGNDLSVNQADYLLWRANFGKTMTGSTAALAFSSGSLAAIPEPASALLLAMGALGLAFRRRRAR